MKQVRAGSIVPMVRNLGLFFAVILCVVIAMVAGQFPNQDDPYVPALSSKYYYEKGNAVVQDLANRLGGDTLKTILKTELPVLGIADEAPDGKTFGAFVMIRASLNLLTGVRLEDPLTYLMAEVPMMDVTPVTADSYDETGFDDITEGSAADGAEAGNVANPTVENNITSDKPLVAFYTTHTSETYELTDGSSHIKGKAGGISLVAQEIQKVIQEQYKIAAIYSPSIHDLVFNKSYVESEKTVIKLLKENPGLRLLFDIHRDGSMTREQSLVKINDQEVAKILLIVGTDARAEHPEWRKNLELARKIAAKMDYMYPGLSRGIAIKQGRYNQQYSPNALLVEIGSDKNTTDEAIASGRLFANVIVAVLNDMEAAAGSQ